MATRLAPEPFHISSRFYLAMQAKAMALEAAARNDEEAALAIDHPDHLRRLRLLIQAQRDEADRLRDFLGRTATQTS